MQHLDFEPDDEPVVQGVPMNLEHRGDLALRQVMPEDFPLHTLLRFLPDVKLKKAVEVAAAAVLVIDVTAEGGLMRLDEALPVLRQAIDDADAPFTEPVGLANQLHKRLTGLRTDFKKPGEDALQTGNDRLKAERKRLAAIDAERTRLAQEAADKAARESLAQAAKDAAARNAPKDVVAALKKEAKTATAPPVYVPPSAAPLQHTSVVEKWKCRLKGTPDDAEPNPEMDELSLGQQQQVRTIFKAIAEGWIPLTAATLDWSYLNGRAHAEKTTFDMPELEAFDEGGTRSKPGTRPGKRKRT